MKPWIVSIITAIFLFTGFAEISHAGGKLTMRQARALFPGSFVGTFGTDTPFSVNIRAGGTMIGRADGKVDSGKWRIKKNGKFCMTWKVWGGGEERCLFVFRQGRWFTAKKSNGKQKLRFRRQ